MNSLTITAREYQNRYGNGRLEDEMPIGIVGKSQPKAQIRIPKKRTPNKTEAAWMEQAKRRHPGAEVKYEPFTLNLPSGTKYTPDVAAFNGGDVTIYEVKGPHIHNQRSIHAFKEAKAAFPFWEFKFAQLTKQGWAVV